MTFALKFRKIKIKDDLETRIVHLETKVTRLEGKVEQQQTLISRTKSLSMKFDINQEFRKNAILRTCREVHASNPLLDSGMYWIDPDGQGVGDDPINVFCNMTTGRKQVLNQEKFILIRMRRIDFCKARQRIENGRQPMPRARMLFKENQLLRKSKTN